MPQTFKTAKEVYIGGEFVPAGAELTSAQMFQWAPAKGTEPGYAVQSTAPSTEAWQDPTTGKSAPTGIGMPTPLAPSGTPISDEAELQERREQLSQIGIPESEWSKYISSPEADPSGQGRLYYAQPATLTSPSGERKIVPSGSTEASGLLSAGWTLGDQRIVDEIVDSGALREEPDIDTKVGVASDNGALADQTIAGIGTDVKTAENEIEKYLKLLEPSEESDLSRRVSELMGEAGEAVGALTGRQALQLSEEEKRGLEEQRQIIADKTTELNKKLAEIKSLTASYEVANLEEEGRPQTLSR